MADERTGADLVDFHSHILPADHGSDSIETTLIQLEYARAAGVKRIIATPHFYPASHTVDGFIQRRDSAYRQLVPHLTAAHPEVRLGAEVLICNGIENLPDIDKLFINGTNTLLLELPFSDYQKEYTISVERMLNKGIDVVIAHADRYISEIIDELLNTGARLQLNAGAFAPLFVRKAVNRWVENGNVIALGSDIHGPDKTAYRNFVKAQKKLGKYVEYIKSKSDDIWRSSVFV